MYQSIFQLLLKISADGTRELTKVQQQFVLVGKSGQDAGMTIGRAWKMAAAGLGTAVATFYTLKKLVDAAAAAEMKQNMRTAFESLRGDAIPAIEAVQAAFRGLLSRGEATKIGSQFSLLKLSAEQMGQAADAAFKLTAASGGDANAAAELLTRAMAGGRAAGLKQWGITLDLNAAYKIYADKIGATVEQLDAQTKRQIRVEETLRAVNLAFKDLDTSKLKTDMQAASVAMQQVITDAQKFAGVAVIQQVHLIDLAVYYAANALTLGGVSDAYDKYLKVLRETQAELAANADATREYNEEAGKEAAVVERKAAQQRIAAKAYADLDKALAAVNGQEGITAKTTQELMEVMYGNGLATADTVEELDKFYAQLIAAQPTLVAYGSLLQWQGERINGMVTAYGELREATEARRRDMLAEQEAAKRGAEAWASLGRGMETLPEHMPKARVSGGGGPAQSRPETMTAELDQLERLEASAQDELSRIVAEGETKRYLILEDFRAKKIDGIVLGNRMFKANADEEAALTKYKLEVEADAEKEALGQREAAQRADAEFVRGQEQEEEDQHRRKLDRMEEMRVEIAYLSEGFRANMDAMSLAGWEFAGQMSDAMDGAEGAATAFSTAAIMGQDSYAKTIPTGIAASGRLAGAFVKDQKAQALIRGGFEAAAAISALAYGNFLGAALHGASAAMFFAVAGGAGATAAKPAAVSSDATSTNRSALSAGGGNAEPQTVVINLSGFAIGSEAQLGQHIGGALNAVAGKGLVLDKRLTGLQVMGF